MTEATTPVSATDVVVNATTPPADTVGDKAEGSTIDSIGGEAEIDNGDEFALAVAIVAAARALGWHPAVVDTQPTVVVVTFLKTESVVLSRSETLGGNKIQTLEEMMSDKSEPVAEPEPQEPEAKHTEGVTLPEGQLVPDSSQPGADPRVDPKHVKEDDDE